MIKCRVCVPFHNEVYVKTVSFVCICIFSLYTVIEKSHNRFLTHVLFVKKYIVFKSENRVILSAGNVHRVQRCMHSLSFLKFERFLSCTFPMPRKRLTSRFVWHMSIEKCIAKLILKLSKNEMPGSVRQ
jgi:hypothetical protein